MIDSDWFIDKIVELWSSRGEYSKNKLFNLSLKLINAKNIERILNALKYNFIIKNIMFYTSDKFDSSLKILVNEFSKNRIASNVVLNWVNKQLNTDDENAELLYSIDIS